MCRELPLHKIIATTRKDNNNNNNRTTICILLMGRGGGGWHCISRSMIPGFCSESVYVRRFRYTMLINSNILNILSYASRASNMEQRKWAMSHKCEAQTKKHDK